MKKIFGKKGGPSGGAGSSGRSNQVQANEPESLKAKLSLGGEAAKGTYQKPEDPGFKRVKAKLGSKKIKEDDLHAEDIE